MVSFTICVLQNEISRVNEFLHNDRPSVADRNQRENGREQDLQAARATAPLGCVLGLTHKEALTPHAREVHSVRRNAVGSAN
jgi:hypothetical protein